MKNIRKKTLSFFLCMIMLLSGMAVPVNADESNYITDGTERYDTLNDALASSDADILEVVGTVTETAEVFVDRDLTLTGNGCLQAEIINEGAELRLGDGSIGPEINGSIYVTNGHLVISKGVSVSADSGDAVTLEGHDTTAEMDSAVITAEGPGQSGIYATGGATLVSVTNMTIQGGATAITAEDNANIGQIDGGEYISSGGEAALLIRDGAFAEQIVSGQFTAMEGSALSLYNEAQINKISGGVFEGTPDAVYEGEESDIGMITGGFFRGIENGLFSSSGIGRITGGTFIGTTGCGYRQESHLENGSNDGFVNEITGGIFYGDRNAVYLSSDAQIEPGIDSLRGAGRYYGGDAVFGLGPNAHAVFPEGYSMTDEPFTETIEGFENGFCYLAKDGDVTATVVGSERAQVTVSKGSRHFGDTITVKVTIPEHEVLSSISGTYTLDGEENELELTAGEAGSYTFIMPVGDVVITTSIAPQTLTVSFDAGTDIPSPEQQTIAYGDKIQEPECRRPGYVLEGWYTGTGTENRWDFDSDTVTENMTLHAHWAKDTGDLVITSHAEDMRTRLFKITGEGVDLQVAITGEGSVTVKDIPSGEYTVTKENGWSWRDAASGAQTVPVHFREQSHAEFTSAASNTKWLDHEDSAGIDLE